MSKVIEKWPFFVNNPANLSSSENLDEAFSRISSFVNKSLLVDWKKQPFSGLTKYLWLPDQQRLPTCVLAFDDYIELSSPPRSQSIPAKLLIVFI